MNDREAGSKTQEQWEESLVLQTEQVPKIPCLLPKNDQVGFTVGSLAASFGLVSLFITRLWNVEKGTMLENSEAYSFCEFLYLFLYVCQGCVRAPPPNEHDYVDWFLGKVHQHCQEGADGVCVDVSIQKEVRDDTTFLE